MASTRHSVEAYSCMIGLVVLFSSLGVSVGAHSRFLASKWDHETGEIVEDFLRSDFGGDPGTFAKRRDALETRLRPFFRALPKTKNGRLAPDTVRYALHRHFVREYASYIHGLEPAGGVWNSSSKVDELLSDMPWHIRKLFTQRLESEGGFNLRELSLFGATLDFLIHDVALRYLKMAYDYTNHSKTDLLSDHEVQAVVLTCMKLYFTHSHVDTNLRLEGVNDFAESFPGWSAVVFFVKQKFEEVLRDSSAYHSFADVTRLVDLVIDGLGSQQQADCDSFTDDLRKIEVPGSGRVKLSNFYATRYLEEPPEFLRSLGALEVDEMAGMPTEPHVIISNYVASKTNCVASTHFYAVCCPDACEPLFTHLEQHLAEPTASPEHIIRLVQKMPSRTQSAPVLAETLVRRLYDIAEVHEGRVPLHGRLFAQWMHLAYPYECQLPAKLGTTTLMASKDLHRLTEGREKYNSEKARAYLMDYGKAKDLEGGDLASTVLWQTEEISFRHSPSSFPHHASVIARALMSCCILFVLSRLLSVLVAPSTPKTSGRASWSM